MKIYNKITLGWNDNTQTYDNVLYEDSYEYEGELIYAQGDPWDDNDDFFEWLLENHSIDEEIFYDTIGTTARESYWGLFEQDQQEPEEEDPEEEQPEEEEPEEEQEDDDLFFVWLLENHSIDEGEFNNKTSLEQSDYRSQFQVYVSEQLLEEDSELFFIWLFENHTIVEDEFYNKTNLEQAGYRLQFETYLNQYLSEYLLEEEEEQEEEEEEQEEEEVGEIVSIVADAWRGIGDDRPDLGLLYGSSREKYSTWQNKVNNTVNTFTDFFKGEAVGDNENSGDQVFTPNVDVGLRINFEEDIDVPITVYYDKDISPFEYQNSLAPAEVQFNFHSSEPEDGAPDLSNYYIAFVDWGDGLPIEYDDNPYQISLGEQGSPLKHHYEEWGPYTITGYMLKRQIRLVPRLSIDGLSVDIEWIPSESAADIHFISFALNVFLNKRIDYEDEFQLLGGNGYTFIPYNDTVPVINGVSKNSLYYKTIKRVSGYIGDVPEPFDLKVMNFRDRLKVQIALHQADENKSGVDIDTFDKVFDSSDNLIHNGYKKNSGELGVHIGDIDIGQARLFVNGSLDMQKMLGLPNHAGNPKEPTYWKNIIPSDHAITDREGVWFEDEKMVVDENSTQEWKDGYYYPVLPKLNRFGKFDESYGLQNDGNNIPFGSSGRTWDEDDDQAFVTSLDIHHSDLVYDINLSDISDGALMDNSGNKNFGMLINDYRIDINENREPIKVDFPATAKLGTRNDRKAF